MPINQPSNQVKLTNVSLVRLKKGKKRFELACYKNKVLEYRQGLEKDLDEVLQIHSVFLNVSKGQTAPSADLHKAFGAGTKLDDIILEILNKGEIQVGEKERAAQLEQTHAAVLDIVAGRLVDPKSKRVYTTGMIDKALDMLAKKSAEEKAERAEARKEASASASGTSTPLGEAKTGAGDEGTGTKRVDRPLWTGVVATKDAKSQALLAMKALVAWQPIPVTRARMRVRISCQTTVLKQTVKVAAVPSTSSSSSSSSSTTTTKGKGGGESGENTPAQQQQTKSTVKDRLLSYMEQVESQGDAGGEWECVGFIEPGAFKPLGEFVAASDAIRGRARVEVLDMAVTHEGD